MNDWMYFKSHVIRIELLLCFPRCFSCSHLTQLINEYRLLPLGAKTMNDYVSHSLILFQLNNLLHASNSETTTTAYFKNMTPLFEMAQFTKT